MGHGLRQRPVGQSLEGRLQILRSNLTDRVAGSISNTAWHKTVAEDLVVHIEHRRDSGRWNNEPAMLKREQEGLTGDTTPKGRPAKKNGLNAESSKPSM